MEGMAWVFLVFHSESFKDNSLPMWPAWPAPVITWSHCCSSWSRVFMSTTAKGRNTWTGPLKPFAWIWATAFLSLLLGEHHSYAGMFYRDEQGRTSYGMDNNLLNINSLIYYLGGGRSMYQLVWRLLGYRAWQMSQRGGIFANYHGDIRGWFMWYIYIGL